MTDPPPIARLVDIIEAIELIQSEMAGVTLDAFETDRRKATPKNERIGPLTVSGNVEPNLSLRGAKRRSNLLPDEPMYARQAGDCFGASHLAMTGAAVAR